MHLAATEPAPVADEAPAHLVAAARSALAEMAAELGPLLGQELARVTQARAEWRKGGGAGALRFAAHDLRGLGALYGAPLAGRMAASLDTLLAADHPRAPLVEAHVDAILAVVRADAAAPDDPRGRTLAEALEAAVGGLRHGPRLQAA